MEKMYQYMPVGHILLDSYPKNHFYQATFLDDCKVIELNSVLKSSISILERNVFKLLVLLDQVEFSVTNFFTNK